MTRAGVVEAKPDVHEVARVALEKTLRLREELEKAERDLRIAANASDSVELAEGAKRAEEANANSYTHPTPTWRAFNLARESGIRALEGFFREVLERLDALESVRDSAAPAWRGETRVTSFPAR